MFSFRISVVLVLTFRSMVHFESTWVYGARDEGKFFVLLMNIQLLQHQYPFSTKVLLHLCQKSDVYVGLFLESQGFFYINLFLYIYTSIV